MGSLAFLLFCFSPSSHVTTKCDMKTDKNNEERINLNKIFLKERKKIECVAFKTCEPLFVDIFSFSGFSSVVDFSSLFLLFRFCRIHFIVTISACSHTHNKRKTRKTFFFCFV